MHIDESTERKVKALLQLLTDPNRQVADTIHRELVNMGGVVLPYLDSIGPSNPALSPRLADIRKDIRFVSIGQELERLLSNDDKPMDLEAGTFLLARSAYPNLDITHYTRQLDGLAEEVRPRLLQSLSQEEAHQTLSHYLFQEKGFSGNREHYYDPDNSFFNRVLDRRTGIPITLSALYLFVAGRLGLSCVGVGMPGHFVVRLEGMYSSVFIDCFNGGMFLQAKDCEQFLVDAGVGFNESYLSRTPNGLILARMIRNLIGVYEQQQETEQVDRFTGLMTSLEQASGIE